MLNYLLNKLKPTELQKVVLKNSLIVLVVFWTIFIIPEVFDLKLITHFYPELIESEWYGIPYIITSAIIIVLTTIFAVDNTIKEINKEIKKETK